MSKVVNSLDITWCKLVQNQNLKLNLLILKTQSKFEFKEEITETHFLQVIKSTYFIAKGLWYIDEYCIKHII